MSNNWRRWTRRKSVVLGIGIFLLPWLAFSAFILQRYAYPQQENADTAYRSPRTTQAIRNQFRLVNLQECKYDGHCPIGSTCAVSLSTSKDDDKPGVCEPIQYQSQNQNHRRYPNYNRCESACRSALEQDERFYHGGWPFIENSYTVRSAGRPAGCVLEYHREPQQHQPQSQRSGLQQSTPSLSETVAYLVRYLTSEYLVGSFSSRKSTTIREEWVGGFLRFYINLDFLACPSCIYDWIMERIHRGAKRQRPIEWPSLLETTNYVVRSIMGLVGFYKREGLKTAREEQLDSLFFFLIQEYLGFLTCPWCFDEWIANRFRFIVRVDPKHPHDLADNTWISYCFQPCRKHSDCATLNDNGHDQPGYLCFNGTCQRNAAYWETGDNKTNSTPEMVIVTAANGGYFSALRNFVASAEYWAPNHKVVVYNLGGMKETMKAEISTWKNVMALEWQDGVPPQYPKHLRVAKHCGWKPLIINETLTKYKSIFYSDAGSSLVGPIGPIENIIRHNGIYLVKGQDNNMRLAHPKTFEWFNETKEALEHLAHYAGGIHAYVYPNRYYEPIVALAVKCALDVNCLAPEGSSLENHRYDQTAFSIAAYQPKVRAPHYTEHVTFESGNLAEDLKQPSGNVIIWTIRGRTSFYSHLLGYQHGNVSRGT